MATPQYQQVQKAFDKGGLSSAFLEVLNWDSKPNDTETFLVDGQSYTGRKVASILQGIVVFEFDFTKAPEVSPSQQKQISKAVGIKYAERLVVFKTKSKCTWLWPKKTAGGTLSYEKLEAPSDTLPTYLAQRLAALSISNSEIENGLSVDVIREKLRGSFDTSTVTKKFYEKFRDEHKTLAAAITGLEEEQKHSYATLILNRLMFIYFLQKKEFLNQDPNYLRNCLNSVRKLQGEGRFFSFYKDLLLELFFEGLNKKNGTFQPEEISKIIGKVPYINGGIFGESELESENEISIPDEVFESIFNFFDSFTWHLDTRPTGKSDEINPEVIGYIFEQYINFTAGGKKENGAYYTKQDVTGYMVSQTLVPRILDIFLEVGLVPNQLLIGSGNRYINEDLLHGWDHYTGGWRVVGEALEKAWRGDPLGWDLLDNSEEIADVCLQGESLVEMFHRRERVESLIQKINSGEISTVNDVITANLNGQLLLIDAIELIDTPGDFEEVWSKVEQLSVIDPTCGSGAFLFAALEIFETVYSHLIDVAEELAQKSSFASKIVDKCAHHVNRRYFIRKIAALNNIYGTDLMSDAIETAKLRVFLALASCLEDVNEIEPLPDLDFNLKSGNLVVGFLDETDAYRVGSDNLFTSERINNLAPDISKYVNLYQELMDKSKANLDLTSLKQSLMSQSNELKKQANSLFADLLGKTKDELGAWVKNTKPFHWFAEFPHIISRGGFDVIVGNPPYIPMKDIGKEDVKEFETRNAPDFYAVCFERSLQLLSKKGRHSFIVMISLAAGSKFDKIRKIIADRGHGEWWSTFGKRPDSLFAGVAVVNTILVLAPDGAKHSSAHNVFNRESRRHLFSTIEYGTVERESGSGPTRAGVAAELANAISRAKSFSPLQRSGECLFIRGRGRYWYPALPGRPGILSENMKLLTGTDPTVGRAECFEGEIPEISIAVLGGKLGYLWWSATGDDFNTLSSASIQPRQFASSLWGDPDVHAAATEVISNTFNFAFGSLNAGSIQVNIRWNAMRTVTDPFDRMILEKLGLLHLWRPLNIWYRKAMQAKSENSNSFTVPNELAIRVFSG